MKKLLFAFLFAVAQIAFAVDTTQVVATDNVFQAGTLMQKGSTYTIPTTDAAILVAQGRATYVVDPGAAVDAATLATKRLLLGLTDAAYGPTDYVLKASHTASSTLVTDSSGNVIDQAGLPLSNPMTTAGDIIIGGTSGAPTRLAAGTSGQALISNGPGVAPSYQTVSGGGTGGYAIALSASSVNPSSATTVYFCTAAAGGTSTNSALRQIRVPKAGTIKAAYVSCSATTTGTGESITMNVVINGGTPVLLQAVGATTQLREFSNTSLNIAVAQGDNLTIQIVCPTWSTAPVGWTFWGNVYVE